jgi:hypothetical protein
VQYSAGQYPVNIVGQCSKVQGSARQIHPVKNSEWQCRPVHDSAVQFKFQCRTVKDNEDTFQNNNVWLQFCIVKIWVSGGNLEGKPGELNPGLPFLRPLSLVFNSFGSMAASGSGTRELNHGITFLKALNLELKIYWSLAGAWKDNKETEPRFTFLKALSFVLKKSGSLSAAWEGNQGNCTPCSPS